MDVVERTLESGIPGCVGPLAAAVLIGVIGGGIAWRLLRYLRLRATTSSGGWHRIGRARDFGQLVLDAFPEIATKAERAARRNATRSATSRGGTRGSTIDRLSRSALDVAGAGLTRTQTRATGVHTAVVTTDTGQVNVGEIQVSATARRGGLPFGGTRSVGLSSSTTSHAAAATTSSRPLPALELVPRRLADRVLRDGRGDLPGDLTARFAVRHLPSDAHAAYVASGAYRALLDRGPVDGVVVTGTRIVVVSRRRLSPSRARDLVASLDAFVAAVPPPHRPSDLQLTAPVRG